MIARAVIALIVGAAALQAQSLPLDRIRALAMRDDAAALADIVREYPDDSREAIRLYLVESGRRRLATDSALVFARRIGRAYAVAWEDSFPLTQITRFVAMAPRDRAAKLAGDSVRRAGNAAQGSAGIDAALALWHEALRRATVIADTAGMAAALGNIGVGLYRLSALDSASGVLERAHELAEAVGDRRTAVNAMNTLGSVAKDRGDYRTAQGLYRRALDLRSRIGDTRGTAADHTNLGLVAQALGDLDLARTQYEEALVVARRHNHDDAAAAALLNLGNVASAEGAYGEAARRYGEAVTLYRTLGSDADAGLALHNLGLLALRRGDYAAARLRLTEALAIFARVGTPADLILVRRDLASVAAVAGDLRSASTHLQRAEQLAQREGDAVLQAGVAMARADLAVHLNSFAEAERHFARAEAQYRRAGKSAEQAEARQGLAMLLIERRQYARARAQLETVHRMQAAHGDRRSAALTQLLVGHAHHRQGSLDSARHHLSLALDSLGSLGDAVGEAAAFAALGDLEADAGRAPAAEALYRRGLARMRTRPAPSVSWQLHAGLGRVLQMRGQFGDAVAALTIAAREIEAQAATLTLEERRTTFLADKWEVYERIAQVQRARGDVAAAFAASELMRARQMLDLLARGRVTRPGASDSAVAEREQDLRRRMAELSRRLEREERHGAARRGPEGDGNASPGPDAIREALARAQEEYAELLLAMREDASGYARIVRGEIAEWREVAQRLTSGEVLIEYLVADSSAMAFVITPDTMHVVDLAVGRRTLESLVDFVRGSLVRPQPARAPDRAAWRSPLRRLHGHLIAPLHRAGVLDGARRLIIVPQGELHYLPFAALVGNEAPSGRGEFLIERFDISYAPSASVWIRLGERLTSRGTGVLALAPRTSALPGSREEVEAIRSLYGREATVLANGAASEMAFRTTASRYGIVHLATFGVLNKHNPLFSYVALNPARDVDGRLEVHEVFGLELNARLLVLSACQTALASGLVADVPAGDDWVGLVRAFLAVGAANVIATLWPVEDRATAQVMELFYRRLRTGDTEWAALSAAQRAALRRPGMSDPFFWAGFALVGGPSDGRR